MVFRADNPNENRETFFRSLGIPAKKVYSLMQVHSRDVHVLGELKNPEAPLPPPAVFSRQGDGMVSFSNSAVLAITVADCLPVFLLDTEKGVFSVLHSGWKGTGIALRALEIMQKAGTRLEAVAAVLGPCIQSCCYRVDEERVRSFDTEGLSGYPLGPATRHDNSGWYIGLQEANASILAAAGVRHIAYCTDCTFTDKRLGSFRREGAYSYTRMIAMAGCMDAP
jgi:YfiH family protein